jgi:hypothetical protein
MAEGIRFEVVSLYSAEYPTEEEMAEGIRFEVVSLYSAEYPYADTP